MRNRLARSAIGLAGLAVGIVGLYGQTRDASQQPVSPGTAGVTGVVVVAGEDRPLRRARVTLHNQDTGDLRLAYTDDAGGFGFRGLAAGRYELAASKLPYLPGRYGARRPQGAGLTLVVADAQDVNALRICLEPGAVITGRALTTAGEPMPLVTVVAKRRSTGGPGRFVTSGYATTDLAGVYRIFGLPPGDYVVVVTVTGVEAEEMPADGASPRREPAAHPAFYRYVPAYYPGVTMASAAGLVRLAAGEEHSGVNVVVPLVRTATVSGRVVGPDGVAAAGAQLHLVDEESGPGDHLTAVSGTDGEFAFRGVPPGRYLLLGRGMGGGSADRPAASWFRTSLAVSQQDVAGVVVALERGASVEGRVALSLDAVATTLPSLVAVLTPADEASDFGFGPLRAAVTSDGSFRVDGVPPGEFRFLFTTAGTARDRNWSARAVVVGGRDVTDRRVTLEAAQEVRNVRVTMWDRSSELGGQLTTDQGIATSDFFVVLFSVDQQFWFEGSRHIAVARPAADGSYVAKNLPPGDYRLVALTDVESGEWFDPVFLERVAALSIPIQLGPGQQLRQGLQLGQGVVAPQPYCR